MKDNNGIDKYDRHCMFANLKEWDILAKDEHSFMEVCEWKNGEGYDVTIDDKVFSITHGQLRLLNTLTNLLDK